MLFRRREQSSFFGKVGNSLWPRSGFRRAARYLSHRIRRMPGTPYAIAAGFACGAAVSMLPLPGLHFFLGGLLAWIMRASIIASALGTAVGNPWTFPLIWLWIFEVGNWMLGSDAVLGRGEITLGFIFDHPLQVLLPMMVGGLPTAVVTWIVFFWLVRRMVSSYQVRRRQRLEKAAIAYRARRMAIEPGNVE